MTTQQPNSRRTFSWPLALVVLASVGGGQSLVADDGWRRTAQGWEHISAWPVAAQSKGTATFRHPDVPHPLLLAGVQTSCSLLALLLCARSSVGVPSRFARE